MLMDEDEEEEEGRPANYQGTLDFGDDDVILLENSFTQMRDPLPAQKAPFNRRSLLKCEPMERHSLTENSRFIPEVMEQQSSRRDRDLRMVHEVDEAPFSKSNAPFFYEIKNSHQFPYYLYEFCPDSFELLKKGLCSKFNARIVKLENNYIIESRFDKTGHTQVQEDWTRKVSAFVNEFNRDNFAQLEITQNLDNKIFWFYLREKIAPMYAQFDEISLIIRDGLDADSRYFRIDGPAKLIQMQTAILTKKFAAYRAKQAQNKNKDVYMDENLLNEASTNKSICLIS